MTEKEEWISLNVGGQIFKSTRFTLCKVPDSMLAKMFTSSNDSEKQANSSSDYSWESIQDESGSYLIDRSPNYFHPILNYLRCGKIIVDPGLSVRGVLEEARFYGLSEMATVIQEKLLVSKQRGGSFYVGSESSLDEQDTECSPMSRDEVVRILMQTPHAQGNQLRFQGVNFSGSDLSCLDLRNVNFKYATLSGSNLTNANLSYSCLELANLSKAVIDGAQLLAVKLCRANLEGASMKNCNFEDPHQTKAVLEGANLKGANLEGSQMAGVNLRVASLKNASLRNCDLKAAVLAGADLENCDLSGSDLQEANLRGANFTNATFEGMITPLHMSQAL